MSSQSATTTFVEDPFVANWLNNIPNKMVIGRSLIGSLRSASSFSGSPVALANRPESTPIHKKYNKPSPLAHQGEHTAQLEPIKARGPFIKPYPQAEKEENSHLLQFDQSVNVVCLGNHSLDKVLIFEQCLSQDAIMSRKHALFRLPTAIRMEIYSHCFPTELRKVTLSPSFATAGAFDEGYFSLPFEVLQDVCGGLEAFQAIRHELMTYFWTQFHFHATLSPFTGPRLSPLTNIWLTEYLHIIQALTVEVDFTRFGGGIFKGASDYGFYMETTDRMLHQIMVGLSKRNGSTIMTELNLLCRRYAGFRPTQGLELGDGLDDEAEKVPYCPELATLICDSVCEMRGLIQRCRLSGFTQVYTEMLMRSIYGEGSNNPDWFTAGDPAWPLRPGFYDKPESPAISIPSSQTFLSTPNLGSKHPHQTFSSSSLKPSTITPIPVTEAPSTQDSKSPVLSGFGLPTLPTTPKTPLNPSLRAIVPSSIKSHTAPATLNTPHFPTSASAINSSSTSPGTPTTPLFGPYTNSSAVHPLSFSLKLSRSRSFRKDFEEQMLKSKFNSDYDGELSKTLDSNILEQEENENEKMEEGDGGKEDSNEKCKCENGCDDDGINEKTSNLDSSQASCDAFVSQPDPVMAITPQSHYMDPADTVESSTILQLEGRLTPIRQTGQSIPNSPNTMNQLNEQDPAFLRTLNAMRGLNETRNPGTVLGGRPLSFQNSPKPANQDVGVERCVTSLNNRSNSTRKRYFTFVNRLRGRIE